ncbi:MAG: helix-turn-helix transcriptional regulator [Actinomycetota bacterium]|nr:helix-turn-helix transcriptional regulator [Actinomycetota bacterium]
MSLGWLLRGWRKCVGMNASTVASLLGVGRPAVSNWESGLRRPDAAKMARLDAAYGAGGALVDMAVALPSTGALPAREVWRHNYGSGGGPVWGWVRLPAGATEARLSIRWGPLSVRANVRGGTDGLVVSVPVSVVNPGARVELSQPGWVDFGQGVVPDGLGLPVMNGFSDLKLASRTDPALEVFISKAKLLLGERGDWLGALKSFLGSRCELLEEAFGPDAFGRSDGGTSSSLPRAAARENEIDGWQCGNGSSLPLPGSSYRALREARGLSQRTVAERVTRMLPTLPVTDDQISLVEAGGRPKVRSLGSRLDALYRLGGYATLESVPTVSQGSRTRVHFPHYWRGDVWVRFHSACGGPGQVELRWAPWRRTVRLWPATTITTRLAYRDQPPLLIRCPTGWTVTAGMGHPPAAVDVNEGWHPCDPMAATAIFKEYYKCYLKMFGKSPEDLASLLRDGTTVKNGTIAVSLQAERSRGSSRITAAFLDESGESVAPARHSWLHLPEDSSGDLSATDRSQMRKPNETRTVHTGHDSLHMRRI